MEATYKRLRTEVEKVQKLQKEIQKCFQAHRQLSAQLSENENVKEDLSQLEDSNTVFKLVGPVLLKQDLSEAKETVNKRISFINAELKRQDDRIKELEKQQEGCREQITKLQQRLQQEQTKAALKA
ncbi:Prefoldin beta subunit [Fasciolopsis buskii]|uniref:Prefoldin beta subunit n=1 Tax=Fasciolopsis buskii TaxID=27845 RepID=A0A8E0S4Z0_9TREM|nr:Prefoldin beta subunit [Fasciolopsis buski]